MPKVGNSIGIFDSGIGGLSILKAIRGRLPQYSYIYFADNANVPYGEKPAEEIYELTKKGVERLFNEGCEIVILACNSASACALRRLQQEWLPHHFPNRRILGILVPTIEQVTNGQYTSLGILATQATIESGAYGREIQKRAPQMKVVEQACPGLADLIEHKAPDVEIQAAAKECIAKLLAQTDQPLDAVLLGCTHYSLKHDIFAQLIPQQIKMFDQPRAVAESFVEYLHRHPEVSSHLAQEASLQTITTGRPLNDLTES